MTEPRRVTDAGPVDVYYLLGWMRQVIIDHGRIDADDWNHAITQAEAAYIPSGNY